MTIHGLATGATAANPAGSETLAPWFVALGSPEPGPTWTGALLPGPEGAAPWRPVTLSAGESAVVSVLGDAGPCAAAPGDIGWGGTYGLASIPLVLDVAGFGYVEDVPIASVAVAGTDVCVSSWQVGHQYVGRGMSVPWVDSRSGCGSGGTAGRPAIDVEGTGRTAVAGRRDPLGPRDAVALASRSRRAVATRRASVSSSRSATRRERRDPLDQRISFL